MLAAALLIPWIVSAGCGGCDARATHLQEGIEAPEGPGLGGLGGVAEGAPDEAAIACGASVDCEDGDPCTENRCVDGACVAIGMASGQCCQADPLYFVDWDGEQDVAVSPAVDGVGWMLSEERSVSAPASLYFGHADALSYATGEPVRGEATFPAIDLPGSHKVRVTFRVFAAIEPDPLFDVLRLYADVLDGSGAVVHTRLVLDKAGLPPAAYEGFALIDLALDGLEGHRVQLRLTFDSVDASNNASEGVYIDDLEVAASCPLEILACMSDSHCEDEDPCTIGLCAAGTCVFKYDLSCDAPWVEPDDILDLSGVDHPDTAGGVVGDPGTGSDSGTDGTGGTDGAGGEGTDGTGTDGTGTDGTGTDGTGTDGTGADGTGTDGTGGTGTDGTVGTGGGGGTDGAGGTGGADGTDGAGGTDGGGGTDGSGGSDGGQSDQTWDPSDPCGAPGAPADCCQSDADCDDGDPATVNVCVGADCVATLNPDACTSAAQCDDGEPCTIDTCAGSLCQHEGGYGAACCIPGDVALASFDQGSLQGIYVTDNLETGIFWTVDKTRATSGPFALYCGDPVPQSYAIGERVKSSATTPTLEIPVGGHTALAFDVWKATRLDADVDLLEVFVLREGALFPAWSSRALVDGNTAGTWQRVTVGLGEYAGQSIQLRFVFDSVNGGAAPPLEGTYLDSLELETTCQ